MKRGPFIRYPIDIISVLVVAGTLTLQLIALTLHWHWFLMIPIVMLMREVSLVQHNHAHLTIFTSRFANVLLGWACHLSIGVPLETYKIHHVMSHHRHNNRFDPSAKDWSSLFGFQGAQMPERPVSKAYYVASFPFIAHGESLLWYLRAPKSKLTRQFVISMSIVGPLSVFLAWLNPIGFLTFFVIPWAVVVFGMGYNNYDHHVGCKMTSEYDSSNNFLNFYYTVLSFNEGYHVAHHVNPRVHWSLLPAYHGAIEKTGIQPASVPFTALKASLRSRRGRSDNGAPTPQPSALRT
ncbi:MAG TPA: fatty acid desaturase [Pyrinomonadaceae bacterium]|nr:fatty acid desaturase [Pyrinomonadaceae bacterium]